METIKIKPSHPSQGDFIIINRVDFDPATHEPFDEQSDAASPQPIGEPMANPANQSSNAQQSPEPARGRGRPRKNQEQ